MSGLFCKAGLQKLSQETKLNANYSVGNLRDLMAPGHRKSYAQLT